MCPCNRKPDAREIETFLDELASQSWLRTGSRRWWPKRVFHFTDINNAVEILKAGKLFCREILDKQSGPEVDSASPSIIETTNDYVKCYVRLYFRPRTPTQFRMEGIRPKQDRQLGAHCPVPVFLLFDSKEILTRADCQFSDGNLAAHGGHKIGSDVSFLSNLPFKQIYHVGSYNPRTDSSIKYHRNAEVIVPRELDLSALRHIVCRSPAELDSLVYLLSSDAWNRWKDKLYPEGKLDLFERRWSFVEKVDLTNKQIVFHFSPDSRTPGPFRVQIELTDMETGNTYDKTLEGFDCRKTWRIRLPSGVSAYVVQLKLDGDLAYKNEFCPTAGPL